MPSFFAHCGFKLTMDSRTQGCESGPHFKQGYHCTLRLIINKLLTVDLMVRWTLGSVVLIPAMNSNTWFHRKLRLLCSLWIKNNGPLDSSTHGFDPGHEFKHVISSNMPSIFAHCGFNNGPMDSRTQGFDPGHKFKHVSSSNMPSLLLTVD